MSRSLRYYYPAVSILLLVTAGSIGAVMSKATAADCSPTCFGVTCYEYRYLVYPDLFTEYWSGNDCRRMWNNPSNFGTETSGDVSYIQFMRKTTGSTSCTDIPQVAQADACAGTYLPQQFTTKACYNACTPIH